MSTRIRTLVPALLLALSSSVISTAPLWSAEPGTADVPMTYRRNAEIERFAAFALRNREYSLPGHCTRVRERWSEASYQIVEQPVLDATGKLLRGAWVESLPVTACGEERVYRIRVAVENRKCAIALMPPQEGSVAAEAVTAQAGARRVSVRVVATAQPM